MIPFAKGHATENDFVIIPDEHAAFDLTPELVRRLTDRHAGIGGDGVLRVVRTGALIDAGELDVADTSGVERDTWFMDYRNADGSVAEMCGNGVRLFAHWLRSRSLVDGDVFTVGTRAGARDVQISEWDEHTATVRVSMGEPVLTGVSTCRMGDQSYAGIGVDMGNPHLACVIPGLEPGILEGLELSEPEFDPEFFPNGVNVELLTELADKAGEQVVHMRVHERGVGETRSCGTGTVAAALAALADSGQSTGTVTVVVPGGRVHVTITENDSTLTGPSTIVALGSVDVRQLS